MCQRMRFDFPLHHSNTCATHDTLFAPMPLPTALAAIRCEVLASLPRDPMAHERPRWLLDRVAVVELCHPAAKRGRSAHPQRRPPTIRATGLALARWKPQAMCDGDCHGARGRSMAMDHNSFLPRGRPLCPWCCCVEGTDQSYIAMVVGSDTMAFCKGFTVL